MNRLFPAWFVIFSKTHMYTREGNSVQCIRPVTYLRARRMNIGQIKWKEQVNFNNTQQIKHYLKNRFSSSKQTRMWKILQ